jgi:putative polyhydroxyalkanoate system protein
LLIIVDTEAAGRGRCNAETQAMPRISIVHAHSLPVAAVKERLDLLSQRLSTKYGIDAHWGADGKGTFSRSGASGTIVCEPNKVVVSVDLSFALTPVKGQIENRIRDELEKVLA